MPTNTPHHAALPQPLAQPLTNDLRALGLSRRTVLTLAALAGASSLLNLTRAAQPTASSPSKPTNPTTHFQWKELKPGLHVASGEGGNVLLATGEADAFLVDTKNAGYADTLRREAESKGKPIATVINTHHHADHTGGNYAFASLATISHINAKPRIAPQKARYLETATGALKQLKSSDSALAKQLSAEIEALLKADPAADAWTPKDTVGTSGKHSKDTRTLAGHEVALHHNGPGHTDNDLIVHLPKADVIHTGDLVFHKVWPYFDQSAGCTSEGWIKSLEHIVSLAKPTTTIIPGHGEVADVSIVKAQIDFFRFMREEAAKAVKDGVSKADFLKKEWDQYKDFAAADWIKPITLTGVYDEAAKAAG